MTWRDRAACDGADTELFFSEEGSLESRRAALSFCRVCPVRKECLEDALSYPAASDHGIAGGLTKYQRVEFRGTGGKALPVPDSFATRKVELTCIEPDCYNETEPGKLCPDHAAERRRAARRKAPRVRRACSVQDCAEPHKARGYCQQHYDRVVKGKQPRNDQTSCNVEGCKRPALAKHLCSAHYERARRGKPLNDPPLGPPRSKRKCREPDCGARPHRDDLCRIHYGRSQSGHYTAAT